MKPVKVPKKTLLSIWNSVPVDYYQTSTKRNFLQRTWHTGKLKAVTKTISLSPKSILDVGCASGWFLSQLKNRFPQSKCVGVDVYSAAVSFGKTLYPNLSLKTADVHRLPFPKNSFDLVVCTEVLEHVKDPVGVLRQIGRVTKTSGEIIIEMDSGNWLFNFIWSFWTKARGQVWHEAHIQKFNAAILKQAILDSGLSIQSEHFFNLGMGIVYKCKK